MNKVNKLEAFGLMIATLAIIISIIQRNITSLTIVFALTICAVVIAILSIYVNQINKNSEEITNLEKEIKRTKENFKILERVSKLEGSLFKK